MHQYDSLTSGFLSPEDDLYPKIIVLEQGMPFASFRSKAVVFESPPSCTQPKQTVAKPRGTRERHGAEKKWRILRAREQRKGLAQVKENV